MITGNECELLKQYYATHPVRCAEDERRLRARMGELNVKYGRHTLNGEVAPAMLSDEEHALIVSAGEQVVIAAEHFTRIVAGRPEWRAAFPWPEAYWELASMESGYSRALPCTRFDAFLNTGRLTFIELNTDGCSGMTNADRFHQAHRELMTERLGLGLADSVYDDVMPRVADTLMECYAEFRANHHGAGLPAEPVIGVLDWADEPTHWEFEAVVEFLEARGLDARVVSPSEARYDGCRLSFDGTEVHLIYRRLLGTDYAEKMDALAAVTVAYTDRNVCMVGAPRSQFAFSKKLFAYLHDPRIRAGLGDETRAAIDAHVPWTAEVREGTAVFHGTEVDLVPFTENERENLVLKPCESKCGYGIHQGRYTDPETWRAALQSALREDYIVQEFAELREADYPRYNEKCECERRYVHLGVYVFGGEYCGMLGRTCAHPLLSLPHGERMLAVVR